MGTSWHWHSGWRCPVISTASPSACGRFTRCCMAMGAVWSSLPARCRGWTPAKSRFSWKNCPRRCSKPRWIWRWKRSSAGCARKSGKCWNAWRFTRRPCRWRACSKIALDLPQAEVLLQDLLAVSLVEPQYNLEWQAPQYQLSALVAGWLEDRRESALPGELWRLAAEYQVYLYRQERPNLSQALAAHQAMALANMQPQADRFALDNIVGPLSRAGYYRSLLERWLPGMCASNDLSIRAEALGQTGKQLFHTGDYARALDYLQQALAIQQQIGDKAGEGTTLNNISQIFQLGATTSGRWTICSSRWRSVSKSGTKSAKGRRSIIWPWLHMPGATTRGRWTICSSRWRSGSKSGTKPAKGRRSIISRRFIIPGATTSGRWTICSSRWRSVSKSGTQPAKGRRSIICRRAAHARGDYERALDYLQRALAI